MQQTLNVPSNLSEAKLVSDFLWTYSICTDGLRSSRNHSEGRWHAAIGGMRAGGGQGVNV